MLVIGMGSMFYILEFKPFENTEWSWLQSQEDIWLEVTLGLILAANWLIHYFRPRYKEEVVAEHNKILNLVKSIVEPEML